MAINVNNIKQFPAFGQVGLYALFIINKDPLFKTEFLTPTYISNYWQTLSVSYNYDVPLNSYNHENAKLITEQEFYDYLVVLKEKFNVDFRVKVS